ncbi:MAG: hypothetical protein LQ341_006159 [Variospora aurantia]|nr:MAG: hypothetical protein LQ341_006159 [Variospora aurantia]
MDILQGNTHPTPVDALKIKLTASQDNFPQLFHLYSTYYTPYSTYIRPLQRAFLLSQSYFYQYAFPTLYPIYGLANRLLSLALTEQPSLMSLALLALLLIVSLKVLDMLRRTVIYWISIAIRLAVYAMAMIIGVWIYQRGLEQSLEDLGWIVGLFAGLGEQGERVGHAKATRSAKDARRIPKGNPKGRRRGGGW